VLALLCVQGGVLYGTHSASAALRNCTVGGSRAIRGGGWQWTPRPRSKSPTPPSPTTPTPPSSCRVQRRLQCQGLTFSANIALGGLRGEPFQFPMLRSSRSPTPPSRETTPRTEAVRGGCTRGEPHGGTLTDNRGGGGRSGGSSGGHAVCVLRGDVSEQCGRGLGGRGPDSGPGGGGPSASSFLHNYALLSGSGVYIARTLPNATDAGTPAEASKLAAATVRSRVATVFAAGAAGESNDTVRCVDLLFRSNTARAQPTAAFFRCLL